MRLLTTTLLATLIAFSSSAKSNKEAKSNDYPLNMGNNPCILTQYTADPTARVIDGKLFLYPSTDIPDPAEFNHNGFCMPKYNVFSSVNLMDWQDHGQVIHQRDVKWSRQDKYALWAPDCIEKGGKYYFYFPAMVTTRKGFGVGVGISDTPYGPFKLQEHEIDGVKGFDPNAFIDDDGQPYLYWGAGKNSSIWGAKLKDNMTELESGTSIRFAGLPEVYKEAAFMFKRNGIYYLTFSLDIKASGLAYATGTSPLGPFTYKGLIMDEKGRRCWTNHHSIVKYNGDWILFYHHNDISRKDQLRSVCADYLTFAENGDINPVKMTLRGVGTIYANREIQVDRYSQADDKMAKSVRLSGQNEFPAKWALTQIKDGATVRYDRVDFGNQKYTKVKIRYKSSGRKGLSIANAADNKIIADVTLENSNNEWCSAEFKILKAPKGVADLLLTFKGEAVTAIDWIQFKDKK